MKKLLFIITLFCQGSFGQQLSIVPEKTSLYEPYDSKNSKISELTLKLDINSNLDSRATDINYTVSIDSQKTTYAGDIKISKTTNIIFFDEKNLSLIIKTSLTDKDEMIVLNLKYSYVLDSKKIQGSSSASIQVKNTFPALAEVSKNKIAWDDPREAEVFIGTNFDFINKQITATDWYGGLRFFLPDISKFPFSCKSKSDSPCLGLFGGVYQSKSFSHITYPSLNNDIQSGTYIYERIIQDIYLGPNIRQFMIARDSVKISAATSIQNLGFYAGLIYSLSKGKVDEEKHSLFRFYVGLHFEFIRRNVSPQISSFDTVKKNFEIRTYSTRGGEASYSPYPVNSTSVYSDAYYGLTFPMQYRWKDMLSLKLIPTFGYSNSQYLIDAASDGSHYNTSNLQKWFYLIQYDVLVKLGGLSLNLGGEIRGYFPKTTAIASAYLGTSFSIEKLIDFITNKG